MKVRLLAGRVGVGFSQNAGDEIEVPNEEGKRLIEKGQAEPVREQRKTATRAPAETRESN